MYSEKLKLLVVEDEPDICTAVQSFFGKRDFAVSTTGSGIEALSMIKAAKPDIVLLDIALSDLNGIEVLKRLREEDQSTKVIVITGHLYPTEEIEKIQNLGISGYRNKPLILEEVEQLVYQAVCRKPPSHLPSQAKKVKQGPEASPREIVHKLSNLLGVIRNKCETFTLNVEEGIYEDKSDKEIVDLAGKVMKEVIQTVDQTMSVVDGIPSTKK
jgi:DNA-binding response OmpR family regulator